MLRMTLKEFSDVNLYNNENVAKVMEKMIAESANGILVSIFDDKLVLFDNYEEEFYSADYSFNKDEFVIENFEKIKLERDKTTFNETIKSFLRDETSKEDILEAYENIFSEAENLLSEDINRKLLGKSNKFSFFNNILKAKKQVSLEEVHSTELYKDYYKRSLEKPSQIMYYFDWKNPTKVSLVENETKNIYIATNKEKALNLWKQESFRKELTEAVSVLVEDVVGGQSKLIEILQKNKDLVVLSEAEFKEVISKSLLMEDVSEINDIVLGIMTLYKNFELGKKKNEILETYKLIQEEIAAGADSVPGATAGQEPAPAPEPAPEEEKIEKPSTDELDKVISKIKEISEKCTDEKAKSFLDNISSKLEDMKSESSVDPELLKEIARLLAPSDTEEEEEEKPSEEETPAPPEEPTDKGNLGANPPVPGQAAY